jgi:hypothetical protein
MHLSVEERAIVLLRRQRHDFLNHLQVISGWLQLNRPERVGQYIESITAHLQAESHHLRGLAPHMALVATELDLDARMYGVSLTIELGGEVVPPAFFDAVQRAIQAAAVLPAEQRMIVVALFADGQFTIHTPLNKGEG